MFFKKLYNFLWKIIRLSYGLVSITRFFNYIKYSKVRKKNSHLADSKKTNEVAIFCLGPSLKKVDFSSLKCDTIVVNRFIEFDKQNGLDFNPTFYLFEDNAFYFNHFAVLAESVEKYKNTSFVLNGKYIKQCKNINQKNLFFCFFQKAYASKSIDFTKRIPMNMNVAGFAIELALFLKYKKIYLYGVDFNSFSSPKLSHCYNEKNEYKGLLLGDELYYYSLACFQMYKYSEYATKKGVLIINKSSESLLDAFDKTDA